MSLLESLLWSFVAWMFFAVSVATAQGNPTASSHVEAERLHMDVDEVLVTFTAMDSTGLPIQDLKREEVRIRDRGTAPRRIVAFDELLDRPIRAGILLDTSESMQETLPAIKVMAREFIEQSLQRKTDAAFVSRFAFASDVVQSWSQDPMQLVQGVNSVRVQRNAPGGTGLFSAVFQACSSLLKTVDPSATGNLILLFTDGEDNAGLTTLEEAARACQSNNTKIFSFLTGPWRNRDSTGPKAVRELAAATGGRVFRADGSADQVRSDLREIELEMRNQYRLVYVPADLKRDGAFHDIEFQPPDRVSKIVVRSGYFAPRE